MKNGITRVKAIRDFFASDGGRPVTMDEMKALTPQDREELAGPCAAALGCELEAAASA